MSDYEERAAWREENPMEAFKEQRDAEEFPFKMQPETEAEQMERYRRNIAPGMGKCSDGRTPKEIATRGNAPTFDRLTEAEIDALVKGLSVPKGRLVAGYHGPPTVAYGGTAPWKESAGLPDDPQARKRIPLYSGLIRYFPDALIAVAECSQKGNDQHNPGEPLHWAREKSTDEHDALARHLWEAGTVDSDGIRHSAKVAWRALAALQKEIEGEKQ